MIESAGMTRSPLRRLIGSKLVAVCALILACCPLLAAQTSASQRPSVRTCIGNNPAGGFLPGTPGLHH